MLFHFRDDRGIASFFAESKSSVPNHSNIPPLGPVAHVTTTPHRSANVTVAGAVSSKAHYVAREDGTSRAGAAYIFSRLEAISNSTFANDDASISGASEASCPAGITATERRHYCPSGRDRTKCRWEESAKLTARDRRGGDLFGGSLSVDHTTGVAVVAAAGASLTGLWREVGSPKGRWSTGRWHSMGEHGRKRCWSTFTRIGMLNEAFCVTQMNQANSQAFVARFVCVLVERRGGERVQYMSRYTSW